MSRRRSVVVVTTGGTIASRYDPATRRHRVKTSGEAVLAALPHRPAKVELHVEEIAPVHSFNLSLDEVCRLAERLHHLLAQEETAGVVVTQGTDTLEESAYLLDLMLDAAQPIVLTGAQLPADHPQPDGPRNLADAIAAAASEETRGLGTLVCFNGDIHAARDVAKLHTSALETFTSLGHGPLGVVDEGLVLVRRRPLLRRHYGVRALSARVPLIKAAIDDGALLAGAAVRADIDGLVIEAFGRGNLPSAYCQPIGDAIARGLPVVVTSRCPLGRVKPIYGTDGGGKGLEDLGIIFAGDLSGPKARVLLLVLLGAGLPLDAIRAEFAALAP